MFIRKRSSRIIIIITVNPALRTRRIPIRRHQHQHKSRRGCILWFDMVLLWFCHDLSAIWKVTQVASPKHFQTVFRKLLVRLIFSYNFGENYKIKRRKLTLPHTYTCVCLRRRSSRVIITVYPAPRTRRVPIRRHQHQHKSRATEAQRVSRCAPAAAVARGNGWCASAADCDVFSATTGGGKAGFYRASSSGCVSST